MCSQVFAAAAAGGFIGACVGVWVVMLVLWLTDVISRRRAYARVHRDNTARNRR